MTGINRLRGAQRLSAFFIGMLMAAAGCDEEVPIAAPPMAAVTVGETHSCSITADGAAYCWGNGADGQLGTGRFERRSYAVRVNAPVQFRAIDAGSRHTCALDMDNIAYCWGANTSGQLGIGDLLNQPEPRVVDSPERFIAISAGEAHTCGITAEGRALCWGESRNGELGTGVLVDIATSPTAILSTETFTQISAGWRHTCAVATGGTAYCWGANDVAQLGNDVLGSPPEAAPVRVEGGVVFSAVSAGFNHTCGVAPDLAAYCWGENRAGETGAGWIWREGQPAQITPQPVLTYGTIRYTSISAGTSYSCGTRDNGEVYCWGRGENGQLGTGLLASFISPQIVRPVPSAVNSNLYAAVDANGATHTCGLKFSGAVFCWGQGADGQLGNGEWLSLTPAPVVMMR